MARGLRGLTLLAPRRFLRSQGFNECIHLGEEHVKALTGALPFFRRERDEGRARRSARGLARDGDALHLGGGLADVGSCGEEMVGPADVEGHESLFIVCRFHSSSVDY